MFMSISFSQHTPVFPVFSVAKMSFYFMFDLKMSLLQSIPFSGKVSTLVTDTSVVASTNYAAVVP